MTDLALLETKMTRLEHLHGDLRRLREMIETDPLWPRRNELPEPGPAIFKQLEEQFAIIERSAQNSARGNAMFREVLALTQPLGQDMPTNAVVERSMAQMDSATNSGLSLGDDMRNSFVSIINWMRSTRGEAPLEGANTLAN